MGRKNLAHSVNVRELMLSVLLDITKDGAYSHTAVSDVLDKHKHLEKKDRAFLTRVVEGTLENLLRINYIIHQFSKVPAHKMKPVIRCIIQSAVYQIFFMDAVPDRAACDEAVKLAQKKGFRNLSGFVNGVLRNISRNKGQIAWPDKEKEPLQYLSVWYSMPEWIIRLWAEEFSYDLKRGEDFGRMERMLRAFQGQPPLTVRVDTGRITPLQLKERLEEKGVSVVMEKELPDAMQLSGVDYPAALPGFREGLFYVQDISSMLAAQVARPKVHDFVLDVCAAPGGKAVQIAQALCGTGRVLARDLTAYKVGLLEENKNRCRVSNMEAQVWDARVLDESLAGKADIVVADLPCSGLGVMRRKKDIRYRMTPEKMESLVALQREILSVVRAYVKPGGRLIYSTCTIHKEENEKNAHWFTDSFADFLLVSQRQILPDETGGDGFYIAEFRKITNVFYKNQEKQVKS